MAGHVVLGAAALSYVAILALRLPAFLADIVPSSDTVSPPLLARAMTFPQHGTIFLGSHAGYNDLVLAALGLPFHALRDVPEALPYAAYLLAVALLVAGVQRLAGRSGALLGLGAGVAAAPVVLLNEMSPAGRVPTLTNLCLLSLAVVLPLLAARPARRGRLRPVLGTLLLGAVTGFDTASDPLLAIVGMLPFMGTALALGATGRRDANGRALAKVALGTAVVSVVAYLLTARVASALFRLSYDPPSVHLASLSTVDYNLHLLGGAVRVAMGGTWEYVSDNLVGTLEAVIGLLLCLVTVAVLFAAMRLVVRSRDGDNRARARAGWVLFWGLVMASDVAVFLATDFPSTLWSIRYLTPLWLALAALVPLVPGRHLGLRLVTVVATAALVGANAWSLASLIPAPQQPGTAVLQALEKHHLTHGYADYSVANLVSWRSGGKIMLRQVLECGPTHARLCPDHVNAAAVWFRTPSAPVAVVVVPGSSVGLRPSAAYGRARQVIHVGLISIYVYEHALRLGAE